jgi:O-antigen ligase
MLVGWLAQRIDPNTRFDTVWASPRLAPLAWSLAAFLAVCGASIFVSTYPQISQKGFIDKWVEYLLYFVIAADITSRPRVLQRAVTVIGASALCVAVLAISQEITLLSKPWSGEVPAFDYWRMTGPYQNPTDLATYLMVVIPIMMAGMISASGRMRWALGAAVALGLGCLGRTEAMGAWMGFGVGMCLLAVQDRSQRRTAFVVLLVTALLGAGFLYRTGRLRDLGSSHEIGKIDRVVMWQAALGMIRDKPVLGVGVNTFMANYLDYWVGGERQPRYAHNCFLQVAAETGLLGLGAFLAVLGFLFQQIQQGIRMLGEPERRLLIGCAVGLVAFCVQAAVDTNFYALRQAALFWVLAGSSIGLSARAHADSS